MTEDQRDYYIEVLFDLHKSGAITVNRREFGRWLTRRGGLDLDDGGRFAFTALGTLNVEEAEQYLDPGGER